MVTLIFVLFIRLADCAGGGTLEGRGRLSAPELIRLADYAFVLVWRPVLEERLRAGAACLRTNVSIKLPVIVFDPATSFFDYGKKVFFFRFLKF